MMPKLRDYPSMRDPYSIDIPEEPVIEADEAYFPSDVYIGTEGPKPIRVRPGGGAYIATPEGIEGGEILAAGGIDERIAQLREETAAIRGGAPFEELTALQKAHQAEIEKLTPEQRAYYKKQLAARRRPPKEAQIPDFSITGRRRYEQDVFREIQQRFRIPGGNPFKINPMDAVDKAMTTQLPKRFEQRFGILYSDIGKLEGKDQKLANSFVLQFRKEVSERAKTKLETAKEWHAFAMDNYDRDWKRFETRMGQIEKQRLERLEPPDTEWMTVGHDEQGNEIQQLMGWDPKSRKYDIPVGQPRARHKPGVTVVIPKAAPSSERESINKLFQFDSQLDRIEKNWENIFTGPVDSRVGWLREITGVEIGFTKERAFKEAGFRQIVKDISDTLLRLRSGAQINEQEYKRLTKLVPTVGLPDRTFLARLESLRTAIKNNINIRQRTLEESGFRVPRGRRPTTGKVEVERRTYKGRTIVKYSDGTVGFID